MSSCCRTCKSTTELATKNCSRCQLVAYCSEKCQAQDWRRHKKEECRASLILIPDSEEIPIEWIRLPLGFSGVATRQTVTEALMLIEERKLLADPHDGIVCKNAKNAGGFVASLLYSTEAASGSVNMRAMKLAPGGARPIKGPAILLVEEGIFVRTLSASELRLIFIGGTNTMEQKMAYLKELELHKEPCYWVIHPDGRKVKEKSKTEKEVLAAASVLFGGAQHWFRERVPSTPGSFILHSRFPLPTARPNPCITWTGTVYGPVIYYTRDYVGLTDDGITLPQ